MKAQNWSNSDNIEGETFPAISNLNWSKGHSTKYSPYFATAESEEMYGNKLNIFYDSSHMGRFPQDGNFVCFVSLKICCTAVSKPDLLRHLFLLFCGEHDFLITLRPPQPHTSSLQCTVMHSKCTKNALLCVTFNSALLVHLKGIAVHCSAL